MDKQTAIDKAGSQSELARILGVRPQAVQKWGGIPPLRVYQLRELKPEWFVKAPSRKASTKKARK